MHKQDQQAVLSIIIPIYNVEKYLEECLCSVYAIDGIPIEVILINDGSRDDSVVIINKFLTQYSDITIFIDQINKGQSAARNVGLEKATGKYIMFVDSDDKIESRKIKSIINYAIEHDLDLVQAKGEKFDLDADLNLPIPEQMFSLPVCNGRSYLRAYCNSASIKNGDFRSEVWLLFIKKSVVESNHIRFTEGMNYEDELMVPTLILHCDRVKAFDSIFYYYRYTPNSIMTTFSKYHVESKAKLVSEYFKMLKEHDFNHSFATCRLIGWCKEGLPYISIKQLMAILLLKKLKTKDFALLLTLIFKKSIFAVTYKLQN